MAGTHQTYNSYADGTWYAWTGSATNDVWEIWADSGTSGSTYNAADCHVPTEVGETPEQRAERGKERRLAADKVVEAKKIANGRADALLKSMLNDTQRKNLEEVSVFLVKSESERMFRIRRGGGVDELNEDDKVIARYCIHHSWEDKLPVADTMLAQKLMLEMSEAEFMRIANRTGVRV